MTTFYPTNGAEAYNLLKKISGKMQTFQMFL